MRLPALWAAVATLLLASSATACGGGHRPRETGPTTTLVTVDRWSPPLLNGGPSKDNFCTAVVATYRHMAQLPFAANDKVRKQFLGDYVAEAPAMIASAPPEIAPDAKLYIESVAEILADLQRAGLNGKKITDPQLAQLLLDPKVKAAGGSVIDFVQADCHYSLGT